MLVQTGPSLNIVDPDASIGIVGYQPMLAVALAMRALNSRNPRVPDIDVLELANCNIVGGVTHATQYTKAAPQITRVLAQTSQALTLKGLGGPAATNLAQQVLASGNVPLPGILANGVLAETHFISIALAPARASRPFREVWGAHAGLAPHGATPTPGSGLWSALGQTPALNWSPWQGNDVAEATWFAKAVALLEWSSWAGLAAARGYDYNKYLEPLGNAIVLSMYLRAAFAIILDLAMFKAIAPLIDHPDVRRALSSLDPGSAISFYADWELVKQPIPTLAWLLVGGSSTRHVYGASRTIVALPTGAPSTLVALVTQTLAARVRAVADLYRDPGFRSAYARLATVGRWTDKDPFAPLTDAIELETARASYTDGARVSGPNLRDLDIRSLAYVRLRGWGEDGYAAAAFGSAPSWDTAQPAGNFLPRRNHGLNVTLLDSHPTFMSASMMPRYLVKAIRPASEFGIMGGELGIGKHLGRNLIPLASVPAVAQALGVPAIDVQAAIAAGHASHLYPNGTTSAPIEPLGYINEMTLRAAYGTSLGIPDARPTKMVFYHASGRMPVNAAGAVPTIDGWYAITPNPPTEETRTMEALIDPGLGAMTAGELLQPVYFAELEQAGLRTADESKKLSSADLAVGKAGADVLAKDVGKTSPSLADRRGKA